VTLEPGQALSHYRLVERLGEGGMGVVYLAEDLKLKRTVALKILPPELASDPSRLERFRREAEAVAALNHPNIVVIHSIEESEGTHFLTMERVEGVSLDSILPKDGFPLARIFDLTIPLADALSAAHERGVIHRDLKPANVMVTTEGRVKVLDFGLAKLTPGAAVAPGSAPPIHAGPQAPTELGSLTGVGLVMGTVPYMSPEQLQGRSVDHRTDIFSFGVVLYELATGTRPFRGESSAELISAIMRDEPQPVDERNASLPRHLGRIIAHCLEKDPEQRFQSAKDVRNELKALRRELDSAPSSMAFAAAAARGTRLRRWAWVAGTIAALALVAAAVVTMRGRGESAGEPGSDGAAGAPPQPTASVSLRRSVAVLGFKNLSGRADAAWLSTALSEMLTTELSAGGELRTVPGEKIAEMKRDLSLTEGDTYSKETLARIRRHLGSDYVVLGSYLSLGPASVGQLRLDLRLQDTGAGETIASLSETATEADLLTLVTRTGEHLRRELGAAAMTAQQVAAVRATLPASPEAARAYTEGIERLRRRDMLGARERLEAAAAAEPDHPLVQAALAEVWAWMGYDARALEAAERGFQHSAALPERERLWVEGRYREQQHDWDRAISIYRSAWEAAPDDLDAGLRLARAQQMGGHGQEALQMLAALRALPGQLGADPRIDLAASIAEGLGDFERGLQAARRAVKAAEAQGARLLQAEAVCYEGWALYRLGRPAEAAKSGDRAMAIYQAAGDLFGQADALNLQGAVFDDLGDHEKARARFERVLAISRETGHRNGERAMLNNLAGVFSSLGEHARSRAMQEQALGIARELNLRRAIAGHLFGLEYESMVLGDLETVRKPLQEALAIARDVGDRAMEGGALATLGWLSFLRGDLPAARQGLEDGLKLSREARDKASTCFALLYLAEVERERADPDTAQRLLDESLKLATEIGAEPYLAPVRTALARLRLDGARASEAAALADQARRAFHGMADPDDEVEATGVQARALADQGKLPEASRAIAAATDLAGRIEAVLPRLTFGLDAAHVEIARGQAEQAGVRLDALRREAVERDFVGIEFEARLLLGRLALRSGDAVAGPAALAALEQDARARGFERIARLAAAARSSQPSRGGSVR